VLSKTHFGLKFLVGILISTLLFAYTMAYNSIYHASLNQTGTSVERSFKTPPHPDDLESFEEMRRRAHQLHNDGKCTEANLLYNILIQRFVPETRHGSEALFFQGQCFALKHQFLQAAQNWEKIRAPHFLPLDKRALQAGIARFYIQHINQNHMTKNFKHQDSLLKYVAQVEIDPHLKDTLIMSVAETALSRLDTLGACSIWTRYLKSLSDQFPTALINRAALRCYSQIRSVRESQLEIHASDEDILNADKSSLSLLRGQPHPLNPSQKIALFNYLLRDRGAKNDLNVLKALFNALPFNSLKSDHQEELILYILRTSKDLQFIETFCTDSLVLALTDHPTSKTDNNLKLYLAYARAQQGKSFILSPSRPFDPWEDALSLFLQSLKFKDSVFFNPDPLATQSTSQVFRLFTYQILPLDSLFMSLLNSKTEWIFEAAPQVQLTYLNLINSLKQKKMHNSSQKIAQHLVIASLFDRLFGLNKALRVWAESLPELAAQKGHPLYTSLVKSSERDSSYQTFFEGWAYPSLQTLDSLPLSGYQEISLFWEKFLEYAKALRNLPLDHQDNFNQLLYKKIQQTRQLESKSQPSP